MSSRRILQLGALLGLVWALVALQLMNTALLRSPENDTWDLRVRAFAKPVDVPIVLILIDQHSLDWARKLSIEWPWPRDLYTYILDFCQAGGARVVAFDIKFSTLSQMPEADEALAAKLAQTPNFVGAVLTSDTLGSERVWPTGVNPSPFTMEGLGPWEKSHPDSELRARLAAF